jgi:hypothetical protein
LEFEDKFGDSEEEFLCCVPFSVDEVVSVDEVFSEEEFELVEGL